MISTNPFSELATTISADVMQGYVVLMILAVIVGTVLDMVIKKNAAYFFANSAKAKAQAKKKVGSGAKVSMAVSTVANEVLTSGEFKNPKRRLSHLLTMYGFIIFVVTTAMMIFSYASPDAATPAYLPLLWHLGAAMICVGGYWFWFAIRVDVYAEAHSWYKLVRADLFVLSLLLMATFALLWSATGNMILFAAFIASSTVLFGSVFWSKFAHMFFKPAAAFQKKVIMADGSRENLPDDYDLSDPAVQARFPDIPEYMGKNPAYMGLGIKRESPNHY